MARVPSILTIAIVVIVLVSAGNAQQAPATDSVADAAREQKALNSKQKKSAQKKVYTNSDVGESDATAPKTDTQTNPQTSSSEAHAEARASSPKTDQPAVVKNQNNPNSGGERSPIFDRPKHDSPETIVVPAGTKITVDVFEENPPRNLPLRVHSAKVVNIVQVGSTVVIPALSKVTIQESVGVMVLTDVTIDGVRYDLQTDRVPLFAESMSEATFTLTKDFTIKR
jgi:hypothetical protein